MACQADFRNLLSQLFSATFGYKERRSSFYLRVLAAYLPYLAVASSTPTVDGYGVISVTAENPGMVGERADTLYAWLAERNDSVLPGRRTILSALPVLGSAKRVDDAFRALVRRGLIDQRNGSLRIYRGHRIVRIVATGAVLMTKGCALTLDDPPEATRAVGRATIGAVMAIVEDCATRRLPLPRPARLGTRVGRSAQTVRLALNTLHDEGKLTLVQRGMRWGAELPDGRVTL